MFRNVKSQFFDQQSEKERENHLKNYRYLSHLNTKS